MATDMGPLGGESEHGWIGVVGARTHNLCDVTVRVPKDRIVAFTGVSGSGKTSLALDTVHAEAQLRYLESLSPFVRHFVTPRDRPQVTKVTGLSATLAVDQRRLNRNARSTVATMTGIDAYLGLLYSRIPTLDGPGPPADGPVTSAHFDRYSPEGSCPGCHGSGGHPHASPDLIVSRPDLPLLGGASPWFSKLLSPEQAALPALAEHYGVDLSRPWCDLPERFRRAVLYGTGEEEIAVNVQIPAKKGRGSWSFAQRQPLKGALAEVERLFAAAGTDTAKQRYARFMRTAPCEVCDGSGFGEVARTVLLGGRTYRDLVDATVAEAGGWAAELEVGLRPGPQREIAKAVLPDLSSKITLLGKLGLAHLQLSRTAPSLSGGELQRTRTAAQLGTALTGIIFVLDEPTAGLHPADRHHLYGVLRSLRDAGNTVLLVEHDPDLIAQADWVIDLGPGAGRQGGHLVASVPPKELACVPESVTGNYLDRRVPRVRRSPRPPNDADGWLSLHGVAVHNLRCSRVRIPLNRLTCVTGVSGSGKSSLVHDCLAAATSAALSGRTVDTVERIDGLAELRWVAVVDQQPIGRTPRSNPATYSKAFDIIRELFAATDGARQHGLDASSFSFNTPHGRCETCAGHGRRLVDMHFLPDVWVTCETCDGRRFGPEVLAVTYRDLTIDQVLDLTVDEAEDLFDEPSVLRGTLESLRQVGLGYLSLGQGATELSGGEAQRLKLANAILRGNRGRHGGLVVLDEPVTGLHPADVQRMIDALDTLVGSGNTVVIAEHDLHVAAIADWILDLGPGAGADGGRLINEGLPGTVMNGTGPTAAYLRRLADSVSAGNQFNGVQV